MKKYSIGIDFGTLSGRAVLVDVENGKEMASATKEYAHGVMDEKLAYTGESLPPSYALQDPNDYLSTLEEVVREVVEKSAVDKSQIGGLGIDFTSCTVLPVDKWGNPLCNLDKYKANRHAYVKLWKHHGAQAYAEKMTREAKVCEEIFLERLGGVVSSESAIPKLMEIMTEAPDVYQDCAHFIEAGDWLNWVLTGRLTRSYLFAAFKNAYVEGVGYPSKKLFSSLDKNLEKVIEEKFSGPILKMGEKVGNIRREWLDKLGLSGEIVVSTAIIDAHVAAPAVGMKKSGDMLGVLGTSACYMLVSDKEVKVQGICGVVKDGLLPNLYGYEAGQCCFGDHYAYVAENITRAEYVDEARKNGVSMLELLSSKAEKLKPGESGLIALNWWNGNRSILVDSSLTGLFLGMNLNTKPEHYMRALMEATAFGARNIVDNYKAHGIEVSRFIATGGIARKNPFLMQLFADVLGLNILVANNPQAPATGSAINAAVAMGAYDNFTFAIEKMACDYDKIYYPNLDNKAVYDELYLEYIKLHDYFGKGCNNVMKTLGKIARKA